MNRKRRRFDPAYRSPMTMAYARRMVCAILLLACVSLFHQMYGHLHNFSSPYAVVSGWTVLAASILTILPWRAYQLHGRRGGLYWLILISTCWWFLCIGIYGGLWSQILLKAAYALKIATAGTALSTTGSGDLLFSLTGLAQFIFALPVGVYTWMLVREELIARAPTEHFRFMELS